MSRVIVQALQLMVSCYEVWLCYQLLYCTVLEKQYAGKGEKVLVWSSIVIIGVLLTINRNILFFSQIMFIFCVLLMSLCVVSVRKKDFLTIIGIVAAYYCLMSLLDFFFAFMSMSLLKGDFYRTVYRSESSFWKVGIYASSSIILTLCVCYIRRKLKEIKSHVPDYRNILLIISAILCIVLRRYQFILYRMAKGKQEMQGSDAGFSLLVVVLVIAFVEMLLLKNRVIERENQLFALRDEMSQQYYQELRSFIENDRQMVHDMKNHYLMLREYERAGDMDSLHSYLEEISEEFIETDVRVWTGNRTLDLVLNQKKMAAGQQGITFVIQASTIGDITLSDRDICALFGNLLDNAIEACVRMEAGRKWVHVKIERQRQMLFIAIANSIDKPPTVKREELVTTKPDKTIHGYGLKSVRRIVERYEGVFTYQIEEDSFCVTVSFYDMEGDSYRKEEKEE